MNKRLVTLLSGMLLITSCSLPFGPGPGPVDSVCTDQSGTALVGLGRQGNTHIYNNASVADPLALCETKGARITKVANTSGHTFSLAHAGSAFIVLNTTQSATDWNGTLVEGNWSAQYAGNLNTAPSAITVNVAWQKP